MSSSSFWVGWGFQKVREGAIKPEAILLKSCRIQNINLSNILILILYSHLHPWPAQGIYPLKQYHRETIHITSKVQKYYSLIALYKSPQLHTFKLLANNLPNLHLVPSNLCIFQSPLQRSETYPVPLRSPRCFRIVVGHSLLHCLYQIPSHFPYYLVEVIWVVGLCYPHRQIFVA